MTTDTQPRILTKSGLRTRWDCATQDADSCWDAYAAVQQWADDDDRRQARRDLLDALSIQAQAFQAMHDAGIT